MDRERLLGVLIGLVMLVAIFLLPFSNVVHGPSKPSDNLFDILHFFVSNMSIVQQTGVTQLIYTTFIYQIAAILLIVAALVGLYPLGSGVLGVVGMGFVTFGPYLVFKSYAFSDSNFGAGFYVIWALSLVQIALAIWMLRRGRTRADVAEKEAEAVQTAKEDSFMKASAPAPTVSQPATEPTKVCPNCGAVNGANAKVCVKCAEPL